MEKLFRGGEVLKLAKRQAIDTKGYVFYIKDGYVCLCSRKRQARTLLLILKPGDVFPSMYPKPAYLSYMANNILEYVSFPTAKLLKLPAKQLESKILTSPESVRLVIDYKEKINRLLLQRLINYSEKNIERKLNVRLLYLADYLGQPKGNKVVIGPLLTYQDIAMSIGTTRESVNRLITILQQEGILEVKNRIITIKSVAALRKKID
jgi:CRP-like cAMP-binding protein